MSPGQGPRAVQRLLPHLLHRGQLVQGEGEGVDRVVDEGGGGVQVTFNSAVNEASLSFTMPGVGPYKA